jgi:hypothetical protein
MVNQIKSGQTLEAVTHTNTNFVGGQATNHEHVVRV